MGTPERRARSPRRLKAMKCWAVIDYEGDILQLEDGLLAVFTRRHLAREAVTNADWRVIPIALHSLQHRPR